MNEGDDLLRNIRSFVHGRVPPNLEELVTELVGRTVVLVMTTPEFYLHLSYVQDLLAQNAALRAHLIRQPPPRPPAKKAPAKKAAPRKATPAKRVVKKASTSRNQAFKRGAQGR